MVNDMAAVIGHIVLANDAPVRLGPEAESTYALGGGFR